MSWRVRGLQCRPYFVALFPQLTKPRIPHLVALFEQSLRFFCLFDLAQPRVTTSFFAQDRSRFQRVDEKSCLDKQRTCCFKWIFRWFDYVTFVVSNKQIVRKRWRYSLPGLYLLLLFVCKSSLYQRKPTQSLYNPIHSFDRHQRSLNLIT